MTSEIPSLGQVEEWRKLVLFGDKEKEWEGRLFSESPEMVPQPLRGRKGVVQKLH